MPISRSDGLRSLSKAAQRRYQPARQKCLPRSTGTNRMAKDANPAAAAAAAAARVVVPAVGGSACPQDDDTWVRATALGTKRSTITPLRTAHPTAPEGAFTLAELAVSVG